MLGRAPVVRVGAGGEDSGRVRAAKMGFETAPLGGGVLSSTRGRLCAAEGHGYDSRPWQGWAPTDRVVRGERQEGPAVGCSPPVDGRGQFHPPQKCHRSLILLIFHYQQPRFLLTKKGQPFREILPDFGGPRPPMASGARLPKAIVRKSLFF